MTMPIQVGTSGIAAFDVYTTDGDDVTDLTAATAGLAMTVARIGATEVAFASFADKAADNTTHSPGAIRKLNHNRYLIDLPAAATATWVRGLAVRGTYTGGRIEGVLHAMAGYDPSAVAVGAATEADLLNRTRLDPPTFERSTADENAIQFSWINGTDTLTATRSIDGGAFGAVSGAIAFFRNENNVAQYRLAYNAADRPAAEGVVRYKVTNGAVTAVITMRVVEPGGANVNVLPATGTAAGRGDRSTLVVFVGETITTSITAYQADGVTPLDLSGKSLVMVFEDKAGNDVATIVNANITVSGPSNNTFTFAYPASVSQIERTLRWSLRDDAAPNTVYLLGLVEARRAAFVDPS